MARLVAMVRLRALAMVRLLVEKSIQIGVTIITRITEATSSSTRVMPCDRNSLIKTSPLILMDQTISSPKR